MTDILLSTFHGTKDEQDFEGSLSIYYNSGVPTFSFARYSMHNNTIQVYPLNSLKSVYANFSETENAITLFISGQPAPSTFLMHSKSEAWAFLQICVANGFLRSNPEKPNTWVPSSGVRPSDPIEWIFQNSPSDQGIDKMHKNSGPPYFQSSLGANFSQAAHREIIQNLHKKGRESSFFQVLSKPPGREKWEPFYKGENRLKEYLCIRHQWECRIPHQIASRSKHNDQVENLSKDIVRTTGDEKTVLLLYNVLRTLITYAPDLGFVQGMVDVALIVAEMVLDTVSRSDDEAQSMVFWSLNAILFEFGQSRWFMSTELASSGLIGDISDILSQVYPAVGSFVAYSNYEMFKHTISCALTMSTRNFPRDVTKKLWNIIFKGRDVDSMHSAVLAAIFIEQFPELMRARAPDVMQVAQLMSQPYQIQNEDDFLSIIAAICEYLPPPIEQSPDQLMNFTCSLFHPLSFE